MLMRYLSARVILLARAQEGWRAMRSLHLLPSFNARRRASSLLVLPLIALTACQAVAPTPVAPAAPRVAADVSGTVTAAVQATVQAAVPITKNGPSSVAPAGTPSPSVAVDEAFTNMPQGWPNTPDGPARYADGSYHLAPRELGRFVAVNAPLANSLKEVTVSGRFHKTSGPGGGGYGLIVHDQGPDLHNGANQNGRFVVLEVGDDGKVGAWQREQDRWVDLLPWTPNPAVHTGTATNDLLVRAEGKNLTFVVNGTRVARLTTELSEGRVGVFVGGDGNHVVLDRFAMRSPIAGTDGPSWPPLPTPTPSAAELLGHLDSTWSRGDWPQTFTLLDQLERTDPTALDFQDKRYAAHMAAGQELLAKGNKDSALVHFIQADAIDRSRSEAKAALVALTPTPTPVPTPPKPQVSAGMRAYFVYMTPRLGLIQDALTLVSERSLEAGRTPSVIFTDTWRVKVATALFGLKTAGGQIQNYQPVPPEVGQLDRLVVAYGKDLVSFADEYAASVDTVSATRLKGALARLQSANSRSTQIVAEVTKVAQQYGIALD
jgi:hypothetical protein